MSNVEKCNIINVNYVKAVVKHNMKYQYMQTWCVDLMLSEKCCIYKHFKNIFFPQKYLTCLPNSVTFRICNTRLPIEQGRYDNMPRYQRYCRLYNTIGSDCWG